MADAGEIIKRIRAKGANVIIDQGRLRLVNGKKLPAEAMGYLKAHGKEIVAWLEREAGFEERAAIMEYDGGLTRDRAEYLTSLLMKEPPSGVDRMDWTWFVGEAAKVFEFEQVAA